MKLKKLEVLSEQEIEQIHEATLDILKNCGINIQNDRMLSFLGEKGLSADHNSQLVHFTRTSIEDALGHIPPPLVRNRGRNNTLAVFVSLCFRPRWPARA